MKTLHTSDSAVVRHFIHAAPLELDMKEAGVAINMAVLWALGWADWRGECAKREPWFGWD
jgi:hypothetical protein